MPAVNSKHAQYKRILLKLSGEALMGEENFGIDPKVLNRMALEIGQLVGIGVQVGIVIGGGNLFSWCNIECCRLRSSDGRPYGYAGDCYELIGTAGCARAIKYSNACYVCYSDERRCRSL